MSLKHFEEEFGKKPEGVNKEVWGNQQNIPSMNEFEAFWGGIWKKT